MTLLLWTLLLASPTQDAHPLSLDRTGLQWVLPFEAARKKATDQSRLLMIKPVAFGTSPEGGW